MTWRGGLLRNYGSSLSQEKLMAALDASAATAVTLSVEDQKIEGYERKEAPGLVVRRRKTILLGAGDGPRGEGSKNEERIV